MVGCAADEDETDCEEGGEDDPHGGPAVDIPESTDPLREEGGEQLLASIDMALGESELPAPTPAVSYTTVGLGSQILKDLGVGKIHLMGAPIKYNAISGFDLEVLDFVDPS